MYGDGKVLVHLLRRPSSRLPLRIERMLFELQRYEFVVQQQKKNIRFYKIYARGLKTMLDHPRKNKL